MQYIGNIKADILLESENEIVIYGCGRNGKAIYEWLTERGLTSKIKAFCDGNKNIVGNDLYSIPILSVDEAVKKYRNAAYLVASCYVKSMVKTLNGYNIEKIHVTRI